MSVSTSSRGTVAIVPAAVAGLVAGIIMAMVAMIVTWAMGMGAFAPPAMIAAIILGPSTMMAPTGSVVAIGLILHMILSMMFGVVFALLAPLIRGSYLTLGLAYGLVLWIVNFYGLSYVSAGARAMATHEPVGLAVGTHLIFGVVLGALFARLARPTHAAAA